MNQARHLPGDDDTGLGGNGGDTGDGPRGAGGVQAPHPRLSRSAPRFPDARDMGAADGALRGRGGGGVTAWGPPAHRVPVKVPRGSLRPSPPLAGGETEARKDKGSKCPWAPAVHLRTFWIPALSARHSLRPGPPGVPRCPHSGQAKVCRDLGVGSQHPRPVPLCPSAPMDPPPRPAIATTSPPIT